MRHSDAISVRIGVDLIVVEEIVTMNKDGQVAEVSF